jgi:hypothetical protein
MFLVNTEKTSLRDEETQSRPYLSPSSRWRSKLSPSSTEAGTKPLTAEKTKDAVADLKRGLYWEVKQVSDSITGF